MIDQFRDVADAVRLEIPKAHRVPVAIVGAGGIVDGAHLPAYKKAGLDIVGITDVDLAKASDVATRHGIKRVYASLDEMLAESEATIFDIAVPAVAQPEIFAHVASAKKHILAQKPFATTVAAGEAMVKQATDAGIIAAVNQQLRFEEGVAAGEVLGGAVGEGTAGLQSERAVLDIGHERGGERLALGVRVVGEHALRSIAGERAVFIRGVVVGGGDGHGIECNGHCRRGGLAGGILRDVSERVGAAEGDSEGEAAVGVQSQRAGGRCGDEFCGEHGAGIHIGVIGEHTLRGGDGERHARIAGVVVI